MSVRERVLVVDFGSSNVRSCLIDARDGSGSAMSVEPLHTEFPQPGWAEMSPECVWRCAQSAVCNTLKHRDEDTKIIALSFSFMGHSLMLADAQLNPLSNLIISFDSRAVKEAETLRKRIGDAAFHRITGAKLDERLVCSKALWLLDREPRAKRADTHLINLQQFILARLGLDPCMDYTLAATTSFLDIDAMTFSKEMFSAVGVEESKLCAQAREATYRVGDVNRFGEVEFPGRIPVTLGTHDAECGFLGLGIDPAGGVSLGEICGTYEIFGSFVPLTHQRSELANVEYIAAPLGNGYVLGNSVLSGAYIEWFREKIVGLPSEEFFERFNRATVFDGRSGVRFLPQAQRSASELRGLELGISAEEIYRGILEGITFRLYEIEQQLEQALGNPFECVRCGGGGAKFERWLQLKADIYDRPVERVTNSEVSCVGAAILACVATGVYGSCAEAQKNMVRVAKTHMSRPELTERYRQAFEAWKDN